MTITYPKDDNPTKETFGVGARVDVPAGKVHEVWIGDEGMYGGGWNGKRWRHTILILVCQGVNMSLGNKSIC